MPSKGQILIGSGVSLIGSSASTPVTWDGGRSTVIIDATNFGTGVNLLLQAPTGNFIPIASAFVAAQSFPFDAPPGQYKLAVGSGTCVGLSAILTSTTYLG